ncbi:MAG: hypothetical protein K2X82_24665 [Gemmataceae bacterium]|nr:hypothetical protein [Gemmataceae bacterium]
MTDRENQRRLDRLAMKYLAAADAGDFDTLDALWDQADRDDDLAEMLFGLHDAVVADQDRDAAAAAAVVGAIEAHLPSAEVVRPTAGPLTVAEVAEHLRRHPPRGLTADDLAANDRLRAAADPLPDDLGLPQVVGWGRRYGAVPQAYWKAFREAAVLLTLRRESAETYRMAARPAEPKPREDRP